MDINPDSENGHKFEEFELGHYAREENLDLLIMICCWNDSDPNDDS